jgi:hypothetical protein
MTPDLDEHTLPRRTTQGRLRPLVYSPRETEILLNVSHASVYRLLASGKLRRIKIGTRTGITAASIDALLAEAE